MESREKLDKDVNKQENPGADVAFEPYFDENTEMGVKISEESVTTEKTKEKKSEKTDASKKKKKRPVDAGGDKKAVAEKAKKKRKRPVEQKGSAATSSDGVTEEEGSKLDKATAPKDNKKPVAKKTGKKPIKKKKATDSKGNVKTSTGKKTSNNKKKKTKKGSLKAQLVAVVALPILVVSIVLTINTATSLKSNIVETEKDGLKTTAITLKSTFEGMAGNDTNYVERSSVIWQGDIRITGKDEIVEKISANGDVQVSFVFDNRRILTSFKDESGQPLTKDGLNANNQIDDEIYQKVVVGGEEYFDTSAELHGDTYYGYYLPLKNDEGKSTEKTVGLIFIGRNSEEIDKLILTETVKAVAVCAVLTVASIIIAVIIAGNISKMINRLAGSLAKIADGNLAVDFDKKALTSSNEIGQIGRASERLKDGLNDIVSNIKESVDVLTVSAVNLEGTSDRTNTTMIEVSKAVEEIAESAGIQASETEKATINAMDMGNLIENVIHNVEELQNNARVMGEAEKASSEIITELSKSNDKTIEAVERIAVQAEYTNVSAQKIKKAVALITSIADETSLLSLNASIEAARAGEAGRGFAVVASEISKLADQSNNSATEIEKVINELLVESNKTVDIMDEVKAIVSEQEEKLNMTKAEFENVSKGIESSVSSVENISGRIVELDIAKNGIIDVIQSLSAISEENAAATEETSASVQELDNTVGNLSEAAKDLKVIAEQLEQQISVFKV